MPAGGTLTIAARNLDMAPTPLPPGQYVEITVVDSGMSPETVAKVFDPFFTTTEVGKRTGLGLWAADNELFRAHLDLADKGTDIAWADLRILGVAQLIAIAAAVIR